MREIVQETTIEANAFMRLMAKNVTEVMSSSIPSLPLTTTISLVPRRVGWDFGGVGWYCGSLGVPSAQ